MGASILSRAPYSNASPMALTQTPVDPWVPLTPLQAMADKTVQETKLDLISPPNLLSLGLSAGAYALTRIGLFKYSRSLLASNLVRQATAVRLVSYPMAFLASSIAHDLGLRTVMQLGGNDSKGRTFLGEALEPPPRWSLTRGPDNILHGFLNSGIRPTSLFLWADINYSLIKSLFVRGSLQRQVVEGSVAALVNIVGFHLYNRLSDRDFESWRADWVSWEGQQMIQAVEKVDRRKQELKLQLEKMWRDEEEYRMLDEEKQKIQEDNRKIEEEIRKLQEQEQKLKEELQRREKRLKDPPALKIEGVPV